MRKVSQADRETPRDPPDQDKQEAVEKPGRLPPSSQRSHNLISHLYFPDVLPHDKRGQRLSSCPEFLIKLPPELLIRNKDSGSLYCVMKGVPTPFVIWLYNRLNIEDSVSYSLKHDGPLCCLNVNNVGPGQGGSYTCKNVNSAGDAESSTLMKGWHLHAFGSSARSGFVWPTTHPHCFPPTQPAEAHFSTRRQHFFYKV